MAKLVILKQVRNIFVLFLKIILLKLRAKAIKKKSCIILVAEFGTEGGDLTYFKYILEYFNSKKNDYLLVLSREQKLFIADKIDTSFCAGIIDKPEVWRPHFTRKNKRSHNLSLFINQLQELLFFSRLNVKYRPACFYFSVTNPEHYLFEFALSAKLIYICHTLAGDPIDAVKKRILNTFISRRKRIIAVSEFAKKMMIGSWKINQRKVKYITVVYNYYDLPGSNIKNGSPRQSFNILTIGSVVDYKDPFLWCEVAKKLTDQFDQRSIHFFWLGSGSLLNECRQKVSEYSNIHFEGFNDCVENYYRISDVYMQPSKTESFGISVAGAMAHKIPCIVSDAGGLPEVVSDTNSGFIIKEQQADMYVDKLKYLLLNPAERSKMGEQGYELFKNKFTKSQWVLKMDALLLN